ncbi:hypothetical protein EWF20_01500 [Sulfolobus sp. S-194]|uniref:hypothetical protein n=1 Tax=Sulfolobus sp. S-194 TaxID=2512240 RepID=UPI0014370405|nr:hypothetical protein [Sulfolobus sp. S-194]QIW22964.1 hypothetical protein EWF20_01500 [Sulfolobus sp. S-194]
MRSLFYLSIIIFLLLSLTTYSQVSLSNIPFTASIIYTTPSSMSSHIFYLCVLASGYMSVNLVSESTHFNISSITTYIAGINIPKLPLNGLVLSTPKLIGDKVYFIYIPGVNSISPNFTITKANLGYAIFNSSWSSVYNLIDKGIVEDFDIYNNTIYVLWKASYNSSSIYLLTFTTSGEVIRNESIKIPNASSIIVSENLGIIGNTSISELKSLSLSFSSVSTFQGHYFIVNLSDGKIVYQIPQYNGIEPSYVSVSNNTILVSYTTNTSSYLVLYNITTGKLISNKEFNGIAIGYINKNFILAENIKKSSLNGVNINIILFNKDWNEIYATSKSSLTSYLLADGLIVNSSSVTAIITKIDTQISFSQISITSDLEVKILLQAPKPFTISVIQLHYTNYTTLEIGWNEIIASRYEVFLNSTLIANITQEFTEYNVTTNSTYVIKVVAINLLGEIEETTIVHVIVNPPISKKNTNTTTSTTSSSTVIQTTSSTQIMTQTNTSASTLIRSTVNFTSSSPSKQSTVTSLQISKTAYITIIFVIIGAIILVFIARRK